MLLVNKIVKIYYPNQEMGIDQLTCKVLEESISSVKVSYVDAMGQDLKERTLNKDEIFRGIEENKDVITRESTCDEYFDNLCDLGHFDEMIEEMKRGEGYSSNILIRSMLRSSHQDGVFLKDVNEYDMDKALENLYDSWQL